MTEVLPDFQPAERLTSGITGLDSVLNGGWFKGNSYLITGSAGVGKTILANQIAFHHVATGGRVAYITVLAESHAHMLSHLQTLTFVNRSVIGEALLYLSGYGVLQQEGLDGLMKLIQRVIREHRATLLVLEGLDLITELTPSRLALKQVISSLQVYIETRQCTALFLTRPDSKWLDTQYGMVDGVITLAQQYHQLRMSRELEVMKLRGSSYLLGRHLFQITQDGLTVYPRTEALLTSQPPLLGESERLTFDVPALDTMLEGGFVSGSTTLLLGAAGSGKTLLGMHFLAAGIARGEAGLYFGLAESPARLLAKAAAVGIPLHDAVAAGTLRLIWQAPLEYHLDILATHLLAAVRQHGIRRLVLDSLTALEETVAYPERFTRFFTALCNELRTLGVTTIITSEMPLSFGAEVTITAHGVTAIAENVIFMRYTELHSQLRRLFSILKTRESDYDPTICEFRITERGIQVEGPFMSADAVLTGIARPFHAPSAPHATREHQSNEGDER